MRRGNKDEQRRLLPVAHCDHYGPTEDGDRKNSNDDDDDDDDGYDDGDGLHESSEGLTPLARRRRGGGGIVSSFKCLCQSVPFLLAVLSLASLFYLNGVSQSRMLSLSTRLARVESELDATSHRLSDAEATLRNHSAVVARFADSVSNGDVLKKLDHLETQSKEREERVHEEMEGTKEEIRSVLMKTKTEIDTTVR
jgi:hypothetical protein